MSNAERRPPWPAATLAIACLAAPQCKSSGEGAPAGAAAPVDNAIHVVKRGAADEGAAPHVHAIKTVFVILMENTNWSDVYRSSAAPYINSLLPKASWCTQYFDNPLGVHPSEPNYIWLEAGFHLGLVSDADPGPDHVSSDNHLTRLMDAAGVSWKTYAEDAPPGICPIET